MTELRFKVTEREKVALRMIKGLDIINKEYKANGGEETEKTRKMWALYYKLQQLEQKIFNAMEQWEIEESERLIKLGEERMKRNGEIDE